MVSQRMEESSAFPRGCKFAGDCCDLNTFTNSLINDRWEAVTATSSGSLENRGGLADPLCHVDNRRISSDLIVSTFKIHGLVSNY